MSRSYQSLIAAVLMLAVVAPPSAGADEEGAATLQELLDIAGQAESIADLVPLVYPGDRAAVAMSVSMMGAFLPMQLMPDEITPENSDEANALAERLTAEFEALEAELGVKEAVGESMEERFTSAYGDVDLVAYANAVQAWMEEAIGDREIDMPSMPDISKVTDLKEDGDSATAMLDGQPLTFVRENGRWYVRMEM